MKVLDVKFLNKLRAEAVDGSDDRWMLLEPFSAAITRDDGYSVLTVPAGFITDLASVPRLPGMFLLFGGKGRNAAVLHDYLYNERSSSREYADAVFFKAMAHDEGMFTRVAMWLGVRVGGWPIWQRRKVPTLPESA